MRREDNCFLGLPEWQEILLRPRGQNALRSTQRLRSSLLTTLLRLPPLLRRAQRIIQGKDISIPPEEVNLLVGKFHVVFGELQTWFQMQQSLLRAFSYGLETVHNRYPDIIAGVTDCVAHMASTILVLNIKALVTLEKDSNDQALGDWPLCINNSAPIAEFELERWQQHALAAFNFVQRECPIAATPLSIGMQGLQARVWSIL